MLFEVILSSGSTFSLSSTTATPYYSRKFQTIEYTNCNPSKCHHQEHLLSYQILEYPTNNNL